ncbi:PKD domain-containing protein [Halogranum gelatinilyticum]|uniref:PKD domain-containing protein n=1 Tax=Halogranum gelatinilyticum TaxID=660521 RepID=A0A1G9ZZH4_9EURY|nr:PKD domain-containing protein [Halogranum gelatinilyticum]SDN26859.1 PKD domain-containing protein [Halogranum gelatinilyticum]
MKLSPVIVAFLLVTTLVPAGVVGATNEAPLPEAGLDQTVTRGSTVFLDATGSRDPDGRIVDYEWSVTSPTGRSVPLSDESSPRTTFEANTRGQYEVTLTVTDDDGAERTDTLYVTVERGQAPQATVDGPDTSLVGTTETFTATLDRGAAPLERIVWTVDGTTVANRSLSSETTTDSLNQTFGATGAHTISVKLVDTDGLTDTATTRHSSRPRQSPPDQPQPSVASQQSPTLDGPDLVTGGEPLRATYDLAGAPSGVVRSVQWYTEHGRIGSGGRQEIRWQPGDHRVYAVVTYTDGSSDVARFSDGSTTVVADPKPTVSVGDLTASSVLSGEAVGTDGYDNLQSVRVEVDGETLVRRPEITGRRGEWPRQTKRIQFTKSVQSFDDPLTIRITATDRRGQTTTVSKEVTPVGEPEIVESGFVNLPVDSYHERIDPERYAAKHVVKIELNGADPENVSVVQTPQKKERTIQVDRGQFDKNRYAEDGTLTVVSYWSAEKPGTYELESRTKYTSLNTPVTENLVVEPSPPEVRLTAETDGTTQSADNWGLILDASRSFDPDGTDLKYFWGEGADPIGPGNSTGELRSLRSATLVVEDGSGARATQNHSYHQFFVPPNATIEPVDDGPYTANETVTFAVSTNNYKFSKNRYETQIRAKPVDVDGEVKDWHKTTRKPTGKTAANQRQWHGIIEVPASELIAKDGAVEIYNQNNPERISVTHPLPSVTVTQNAPPVYKITGINEIKYLIRAEKQIQRTVDSPDEKLRLLTKGYNVTDSRVTDREFVLEERVKVHEAQYETETQSFRQRGYREMFLKDRSEWEKAGTRRETRTWTSTETEWRDSRTGDGDFTGNTRRKQIEPADYKRQYKYEYTDEETRTGTRTVWETRTRTVQETRTRTVERCFGFRCYTYDETYTVTDEEEYEVQTTERYTYTVTERETYWAFFSHGYSHDRTGESRLIKISPAEYTTQYQYRFEETHQEDYIVYEASRQVQVAPAQYEWRPTTTVNDELKAYQRSRQSDYRLGSQSVSKEWTLTKSLGTAKVISDSYRDEDNVIETRATVSGFKMNRQLNPETGEFTITGGEDFEIVHRESGLLSEAEIRRSYRSTTRCADENPMRRWECQ